MRECQPLRRYPTTHRAHHICALRRSTVGLFCAGFRVWGGVPHNYTILQELCKLLCKQRAWGGRLHQIPNSSVSNQSPTHRPLSSSFLGLPYRIPNINHKGELLRGLWVNPSPYIPSPYGYMSSRGAVARPLAGRALDAPISGAAACFEP